MNKLIVVLVAGLIVVAGASASGGAASPDYQTDVTSVNILQPEQNQFQNMQGQGYAGASASISTISDYKTRTPPLTFYPPYLPYWTHGGWGSLKAYFPTGPNGDNQAYERAFDPGDPKDIRELRSVLESLSYEGPLDALGGMLNGVGALFGGPDNFHHGRGFEIANSLLRDRRPKKKPLLVFVDTNVDRGLLKEAGYVYVGKVSIEGVVDRNWDHAYDAAVAETLPWNVDILLVSGGMKGVTVGSNVTFPAAGGAFTQVSYSLSLLGGLSNGITEGKGKALVSAEGYRYWPEATCRRSIPACLYDKIRVRPQTIQQSGQPVQEISAALAQPGRAPVAAAQTTQDSREAESQHVPDTTPKEPPPGIRVSRELFEMAGFKEGQRVDYVTVE